MSIQIQMQFALATAYACTVPLRVEPTRLVVEAGSFVAGGVEYTLAADVQYAWEPCASARTVRITLVRERQSGAVAVVVDECVHDGVDRPYRFQGSPYEPLHVLAVGVMPAACDDATQGAWMVWHVTAPVEVGEASERLASRALSADELRKLGLVGGMKS